MEKKMIKFNLMFSAVGLVLFVVLVVMLLSVLKACTSDLLLDEYYIELDANNAPQAHTGLTSDYTEYIPCSDNTFKSWMDFRAITNTNSEQYKLQRIASTESFLGLRLLDGYFMIAISKSYGNVGDIVEVFLEGNSFLAIIGDIKNAGHSDGCSSDRDGSMLEFIVDVKSLHTDIKRSGNFNSFFEGKVLRILNYGRYE